MSSTSTYDDNATMPLSLSHKEINDTIDETQNNDISKQINTELNNLIKTLESCYIEKKGIGYDDSIVSRLVANLRSLLSYKKENWSQPKGKTIDTTDPTRNNLIYKALFHLIPQNEELKPMFRGADHEMSIVPAKNSIHFFAALPFMIATTAINKTQDLAKILGMRDTNLYNELKTLHTELKEYCNKQDNRLTVNPMNTMNGGSRRSRRSRKSKKSKKSKQSRKNRRKSHHRRRR